MRMQARHTPAFSLLLWGVSLFAGWVSGATLLVQPVARQLAYDPVEYCETLGTYDRDAGRSLRAVWEKLPRVTTLDYSPVCNINALHIDTLLPMKQLARYGVVRGNVRVVPASLGSLTSLTRLQIQDQRIMHLPDTIGNLTRLETLKLGGNALETLPDSIGALTRLTTLHIYDNRLTTLPDSIGNLTALTVLDARSNRLRTLPDSMTKLNGTLKRLYVGGNLISETEKARIRAILPDVDIHF